MTSLYWSKLVINLAVTFHAHLSWGSGRRILGKSELSMRLKEWISLMMSKDYQL